MTSPAGQQLRDTAASALLHMIDNRNIPIKCISQREAALKTLLEVQHLTRLDAAGLVKAHDMKTMMSMANGICKYSSGGIAALFEHGSSIVNAQYLARMGYKKNVHLSDSTVADANNSNETRFVVCDSIIWNAGCTKDRSIRVRKNARTKYCDSCQEWLLNEATHLKQIGCTNPDNRSECRGHAGLSYQRRGANILCGSCGWHASKHGRSGDKRMLAMSDSLLTTPRQSSAIERSTNTTEDGEQFSTTEEDSTKHSAKFRKAGRRTLPDSQVKEEDDVDDDEEGDEEEGDGAQHGTVDEEWNEDGDELSTIEGVELGQKATTQRPSQLGGLDEPDIVVVNVSSPKDQDPAPLRSLKGIPGNYHQQSSAPRTDGTMGSLPSFNPVSSINPISSNAIHLDTASSGTVKRAAPVADIAGQSIAQYKRPRISQQVADERQNSIEYSMRSAQIQKEWDHVFKLVQNAVAFFFTDTNARMNRGMISMWPEERGELLGTLYDHILGGDDWRISEMQQAGLLKAYHVTIALVGSIIYEVSSHEVKDLWLVRSQDEKISHLVKVLEAQEIDSQDIFKRAEYEWLSSTRYMEQYITPRAANLAYKYSQVLRPYLATIFDKTRATSTFEKCLRGFGGHLQRVLEASMLLQAKLNILGSVKLGWPVSGTTLDSTWMNQLNESTDRTKLAVTMALLPALIGRKKTKVMGKAVVCCHTIREEATPDVQQIRRESWAAAQQSNRPR